MRRYQFNFGAWRFLSVVWKLLVVGCIGSRSKCSFEVFILIIRRNLICALDDRKDTILIVLIDDTS